MSDLNLKPIVEQTIGMNNAYVMTDYFRHKRVDDAFAVVRHKETNDYYIFYNVGSELDYALIGNAAAFSAFITKSYGIEFDASTQRAAELGSDARAHGRAKDTALELILISKAGKLPA